MRYLFLLLFICGFSTELIAQKANQMTISHRRSLVLEKDYFTGSIQIIDSNGYLHFIKKDSCNEVKSYDGKVCVHPKMNKEDTCFYTYYEWELSRKVPWCCVVMHYTYDLMDTLNDRAERICSVGKAYREYYDYYHVDSVMLEKNSHINIEFSDLFEEIKSSIDTAMYLSYHSLPEKPEKYKRILKKEMRETFKNKKDYKAEMKICRKQKYNRGLFRRADLDQDGKEELITLYFRQEYEYVYYQSVEILHYVFNVYMPESAVPSDRKFVVGCEYFAPSPQLRIFEFTDNQWKPVGMRYVRLNYYPSRILVLNVNRGKTVNVIVGIEEIDSSCWGLYESSYLIYDFYSVSK